MVSRSTFSRPQPRLIHIFLFCLALATEPVSAAKLVDENVCILENMGNTRSSVARLHISSACNFLSLHEASLTLNKDRRDLSECVLKYLPGVESDVNATELARSCQQLVWDRN